MGAIDGTDLPRSAPAALASAVAGVPTVDLGPSPKVDLGRIDFDERVALEAIELRRRTYETLLRYKQAYEATHGRDVGLGPLIDMCLEARFREDRQFTKTGPVRRRRARQNLRPTPNDAGERDR